MDVTALAKDEGNLAPYSIVIGDLQNQSNAYLIIYHEVIAEIECFLDSYSFSANVSVLYF